MVSRLKVTNVDRFTMSGESVWWRVRYEVQDPEAGEMPVHYHNFPEEIFASRAAEYDLDSMEEILDIVLAEPFSIEDGTPTLFTAKTTDEARAAHRTRCARAKLDRRISSRGMENPLEMIRSSVTLDSEDVQERRLIVREAQRGFADRVARQELRVKPHPGSMRGKGKESSRG